MKKKEYIRPEIIVFILKRHHQLLAGSGGLRSFRIGSETIDEVIEDEDGLYGD